MLALETVTAVLTANARRAPAPAALQWRKNVPAKIADVDKAANVEITAPVNPNDSSSPLSSIPHLKNTNKNFFQITDLLQLKTSMPILK